MKKCQDLIASLDLDTDTRRTLSDLPNDPSSIKPRCRRSHSVANRSSDDENTVTSVA